MNDAQIQLIRRFVGDIAFSQLPVSDPWVQGMIDRANAWASDTTTVIAEQKASLLAERAEIEAKIAEIIAKESAIRKEL